MGPGHGRSYHEELFQQDGWTVVGQEAYPTGSLGFLLRADENPERRCAQVILPIFDMPQSGILVKQWNSMRVPALMAGFISPLAGPGAWKTFEKKIGGAVNVNFELGSAVASQKVPKSVDFYEAYEKKFGKPMEAGHGPAPTYESVYILAEAIERAGTLDPDAIAAEIKKTDRIGVHGANSSLTTDTRRFSAWTPTRRRWHASSSGANRGIG
jgi:branched-chain amino acid transport system substrate-binding protein